jgi:thymidylate synthase ThyX
MIEDLRRDPAMPVYWGSNKPGMQAGSEIDQWAMHDAKRFWKAAMDKNIDIAQKLIECGLHKQIANRILEPWAHINVVVTATDWNNFFALRRHPDAQPEIKVLADAMWDAMQNSDPVTLAHGAWHLPYIRESEVEEHLDTLIKVSVARCGRVSYLTHDGRETEIQEDLQLHDRLVGSYPMHASPAEHQATPDEIDKNPGFDEWICPHLHGNFRGWIQYRKTLSGENIRH